MISSTSISALRLSEQVSVYVVSYCLCVYAVHVIQIKNLLFEEGLTLSPAAAFSLIYTVDKRLR